MIVGTALALAALGFVLYPLFAEPLLGVTVRRGAPQRQQVATAVDALREIEFDHVTGKLSERDYTELKASYTARAVQAMRAQDAGAEAQERGGAEAVCSVCGPRPEPDAAFCSECGRALAA